MYVYVRVRELVFNFKNEYDYKILYNLLYTDISFSKKKYYIYYTRRNNNTYNYICEHYTMCNTLIRRHFFKK